MIFVLGKKMDVKVAAGLVLKFGSGFDPLEDLYFSPGLLVGRIYSGQALIVTEFISIVGNWLQVIPII
jgi:hypothetical protein